MMLIAHQAASHCPGRNKLEGKNKVAYPTRSTLTARADATASQTLGLVF